MARELADLSARLHVKLRDPQRLAAVERLASLDPESKLAFDRLSRLAARLLDAPMAAISLIDADRQRVISGVRLPEPLASPEGFAVEYGVFPHALVAEAPLLVDDVRQVPLFRDDRLVDAIGLVGYAAVPMVTAEQQRVGTLCVIDRRPRRWSDEDAQGLIDLAAAATREVELGAAVREAERERREKLALLAEAERRGAVLHSRVRQQAIVSELGQRALAGIDLQHLLNDAVAQVAETLGVEYAKVLELQPDGDELLLRAGVGWQEGLVGRATVGAGKDSQAGYTLLSSGPVIVEDLRSEQRFSGPPLLHDHGVVSGLSVIIVGRLRPFGVLGAHTTRRRNFTSDDIHFLQAVANLIAMAVERERSEQERADLLAREQAARAEAEMALRTRDEFIASVSHDLKNPLTSIKGYAQLLQRQADRFDDPEARERLLERTTGIEAATRKMSALVDELLDVARLETGRPLELQRQSVNLVALARQAVADQQQTAERHRLCMKAEVAELSGNWDPVRLERVVTNLLSNAVKYSPEGSEISVRVAREGDQAVLWVSDQGVGIPVNDLPRIFRRFQRGTNVVGRVGGSGLGLWGARQIVEQHGGAIEVDSREGAGTTVSVRLPLV